MAHRIKQSSIVFMWLHECINNMDPLVLKLKLKATTHIFWTTWFFIYPFRSQRKKTKQKVGNLLIREEEPLAGFRISYLPPRSKTKRLAWTIWGIQNSECWKKKKIKFIYKISYNFRLLHYSISFYWRWILINPPLI